MRGIDFSSWQSLFATLLGLALVTLIGMGIRLMMMFAIQQRRERMNRQINERLRTMIAAYKVLGGSFTGELLVDPRHLREAKGLPPDAPLPTEPEGFRSERMRQTRDAVEAALSDIILLGTEEQVRLAAGAASDMAAGQPIHTHDLVISLRNSIREALDLEPIAKDVVIPQQGPSRPQSGRSGGSGRSSGDRQGGGGAGGGGMGGGGGGGGMGMGMGMGLGRRGDDG